MKPEQLPLHTDQTKPMGQNSKDHQSTVIGTIRLPATILVLFIHTSWLHYHPIPLDQLGDPKTLQQFLQTFIVYGFGGIAVPIFFVISGYLFFRKSPESFEGGFFVSQWKKRLYTLLIPYILWNTLKVALLLVKGYGLQAIGINGGNGEDMVNIQALNFYRIYIAPIDGPLWYLRDLIVMAVISPLIFLLLRYLRHWGILLLGVCYLSSLDTGIPGFGSTAIFYFSLGAYYSLSKRSFRDDCSRLGYLPLIISIASFALTIPLESSIRDPWMPLATILGVIGGFHVASRITTTRHTVRGLCLRYVEPLFFVYAVHELYLKDWVNGLFARLPLLNESWGLVLSFFIKPFVLLGICLVLHHLTKTYLPRIYTLLNGGR